MSTIDDTEAAQAAVGARRVRRRSVWPIVVAGFLVDALLIGAPAALLWEFGGSTVFTGGVLVQVGAFVLCTVLIAARIRIDVAIRAATRRSDIAVAGMLIGSRILLLAGLIAAWSIVGEYFLGWVACFGAGMMTAASFCELVGAVIGARTLRMILVRLVGFVAGLSALVVTAPIHLWTNGIVDILLVITIGAAVLGGLVVFWVNSLTDR
ncbi:hypothetical protein ACTU6V_00845 [Microbacterium sp. A204]|uniref:hypothetical protein n=1 Tax=Microbacterium sp. A204 TaxID=3457321 RepID=UPI003FD16D27